MEKKISLRILNEEGNLILACKEVAFVNDCERKPIYYGSGDPSTCYVHYYKDMYVVTQHIISTIQFRFYRFSDAQRMFTEFVNSVRDHVDD